MATRVQIAFDQSATTPVNFFTLDDDVRGVLDNNVYVLGGDVLVDVTNDVRSFQIRRGRSRQLERFTAGNANVALNNFGASARKYDPLNTAGPYYGSLVPRKQIVIDVGGTAIYTGQVADWNYSYSLSGESIAEPSAVDALGYVAQQNLAGGTAMSQKSGARVGAILDEIGWPSVTRNIADGDSTLDANYVQPGSNALQVLSQVGDVSEPGAVFVGAAGDFVFKSRSQLQSYTSNVVFGGTAVAAIPFVEIEPVYGSEELFNEIAVTYTAGTVVAGTAVASDTTSQAAYGVINKQYDTFLASAVDASEYASFQVGQHAQPVYRINALSIILEALDATQQGKVLSLDLGSVVLVNFTPNNVGTAISQYSTIEQIEHRATPEEHRITFTLSKTTASFILDDLIFGTLDNNSLGF
jgi:hypothetical protein